MQTDSIGLSLLWGRMGAAVLVLFGVALAAFGIDFSADEQTEIYGIIATMLTGAGALMAMASKFRERWRIKKVGPPEQKWEDAAAGQSGKAGVGMIILILMTFIVAIPLYGCPGHQTATQQIYQQTDDPGTIAMATYLDGLNAYIDAQELYLPYQTYVEDMDPALGEAIIGHFKKARQVLDQWRTIGSVTAGDKQTFRAALRDIPLDLAKHIEGG